MPRPVSVTTMQTYDPGVRSAFGSGRPGRVSTLEVSIVRTPPPPMASRALVARFSSTGSRVQNLLRLTDGIWMPAYRVEQHGAIAIDYSQQVVKIVGYAAGQTA